MVLLTEESGRILRETKKTNVALHVPRFLEEERRILAVQAPALGRHMPHVLTQLRLAHPLERTTRTRNETETDFPIGINCVDYSPQSPTKAQRCSSVAENLRNLQICLRADAAASPLKSPKRCFTISKTFSDAVSYPPLTLPTKPEV